VSESRLTLDEAKSLKTGDYIHSLSKTNADGTAVRWKVTRTPRTYRDPSRVRVFVKCGYRNFDNALIGSDFDADGVCIHDLALGRAVA
jgi:hypothetical protein